MNDLQNLLAEAKQRFTDATAAALGGDDSAWGRAELYGKEVRRLQAEMRKPKPEGPWAIAADVFKGQR